MPEGLMEKLFYPYIAVTDLVAGGGPFVFWIFTCGVVLWTLCLERYWYFSRVLPGEAKRMMRACINSSVHSWRAPKNERRCRKPIPITTATRDIPTP